MAHWDWIPEAPRGDPRGGARMARQKRHLPQRGRGRGRAGEAKRPLSWEPPPHLG
jgi:hypothetical protein